MMRAKNCAEATLSGAGTIVWLSVIAISSSPLIPVPAPALAFVAPPRIGGPTGPLPQDRGVAASGLGGRGPSSPPCLLGKGGRGLGPASPPALGAGGPPGRWPPRIA